MVVHRLKTRRDRADEEELARLRCQVLEVGGLSLDTRRRIAHMVDRELASRTGWRFVMIEPNLYSDVVEHLAKHSRRPVQALRLWARLFSLLPADSNAVTASRQEIADQLGMPACVVSEIMGELQAVGVIYRRKEGRGVRYFVHPLLGTHLAGAVRDRAQADAPPLKLRVLEGGLA